MKTIATVNKLITIKCKDVDERESMLCEGLRPEEVAVLAGAGVGDTPYRIWRRLTGADPALPVTPLQAMGGALEGLMIQAFSDRTRACLRVPDVPLYVAYRPDAPYLRCLLGPYYWPEGTKDEDRKFESSTVIMFKTVGGGVRHKEIPHSWFCEAQYRMTVLGVRRCTVLCLSRDDGSVEWMSVNRNDGFCATLEAMAATFWDGVKRGVPPKEVSAADLGPRFGESVPGKTAVADQPTAKAVMELARLMPEAARTTKRIEALQLAVKKHMGDCDTLVGPDGNALATWKTVSTRSVDSERLKKERPEVFARFRKEMLDEKAFLDAAGMDPSLAGYVRWAPYQRRFSVVSANYANEKIQR